MSKPYKAKSLAGAERRVRELMKTVKVLDATLGQYMREGEMLAQLAADGPCFSNPFKIIEAKEVRDRWLRNMNLNPDGTYRAEQKAASR